MCLKMEFILLFVIFYCSAVQSTSPPLVVVPPPPVPSPCINCQLVRVACTDALREERCPRGCGRNEECCDNCCGGQSCVARQNDDACNSRCGRNKAPLCGTDGVTYRNRCELKKAICKNPSLSIEHKGECEDVDDPCDRLPICIKIYQPICGSDGVTYSNECYFEHAKRCEDPSLTIEYYQECGDVQCIVGICPLIYSPVCGSDGVTYSNLCFFNLTKHCNNPTLTICKVPVCPDGFEVAAPSGSCCGECRKTGVCPLASRRSCIKGGPDDLPGCESDTDCKGTKKCCPDVCRSTCKDPVPVCLQPEDVGPCRGAFPRWRYNIETCQCEAFTYGGCEGNDNNFKTEGQCREECGGEGIVNCLVSPCEFAACPAYPDATCEENYCGGCNAHWFVDDERVNCDVVPPPPVPSPCINCQLVRIACTDELREERCPRRCGRNEECCDNCCGGRSCVARQNDDPCQNIQCDIPLCPFGHVVDYDGPGCCPGCKLDCSSVSCLNPVCPEGVKVIVPEGSCCGICSEVEETPKVDCRLVLCALPDCPEGQETDIPDGKCCPECRPTNDLCPDGSERVACKAAPCHFTSCAAYPDAVCVENYCGGCFANWYVDGQLVDCDVPVCLQPEVVGPCRGAFPRWRYNIETCQCEEFTYGGCEGNDNNFKTERQCREECGGEGIFNCLVSPCVFATCPAYPDATCVENYCGGCNAHWFVDDERVNCDVPVCLQPEDVGPCRGAFPRWRYNIETCQCEEFTYGGCEGNDNNFKTERQCREECGGEGIFNCLVSPCEFATCPSYPDATCEENYCGGCNAHWYVDNERVNCDVCNLPLDVGPCEALIPRWGFEYGECVKFIYGGCGGNENNFESQAECETACEFDY